jgi:hypothetical protein
MQLANYFLVVLCLFAILTLILNGKLDPAILASTSRGGSRGSTLATPAALDAFLQGKKDRLAGLSCKKYGGPSDADAKEMVYWRDIPADSHHVSPFFKGGGHTQYLTFEPDFGGWNNIRMVCGCDRSLCQPTILLLRVLSNRRIFSHFVVEPLTSFHFQ